MIAFITTILSVIVIFLGWAAYKKINSLSAKHLYDNYRKHMRERENVSNPDTNQILKKQEE